MTAILETVRRAFGAQRKAAGAMTAEIERVRMQIIALANQRSDIEGAPVPISEALAALDRDIDALVDRALSQVNVGSLVRPSNGSPAFQPHFPENALFGLIIASNRDSVRSLFAEMVAQSFNGHTGLSKIDRESKLKKIDDQALQAELLEEGLIRAVEASGQKFRRRPDADPRAVLAVMDDMA